MPRKAATKKKATKKKAPASGGGVDEIFSDEVFALRLGREGARSGELQISLIWNDIADLDLHVHAPDDEHIFYGNKQAESGGWLDVDMNVRVSEMLNGPRVIVFDRLWLKGLVAPTQLDFCCFGQTLVGMLLCLWRCAGPWSRLKQLAGAS